MKVSLNAIKKYTEVTLSVDDLVARINQQLGGVEEVVDLAGRYSDVVVVKVVECEKHPNADKLHVCLVDDGGAVQDVDRDENGLVQVVCGAPNVHTGMLAAWLPPGSTVPASFETAEPFVLDARELRGVISNGMLASAKELAIGDDHDGIIEITENDLPKSKIQNLKPGEKFGKLFELDDTIIDIENKMFTHRPDLFGQLGVAREIAGIQGQFFVSPEWYTQLPVSGEGKIPITVFSEAGERVPRFTAVVLEGVRVGQSPLWLQTELVRLGGKPINSIVDATNYIMLLTAQPTHAYDYDKLRGQTLGVRLAQQNETATLLNGKIYKLSEDDIVIVDGDGVVGLGGVMGGGNSEVSSETTTVVLECANFDMYTVRKTSMRHGLFTDAVTRFSKGQSSEQQAVVLNNLVELILEIAGGTRASQVFDMQNEAPARIQQVTVSAEFINDRLGLKLAQAEIASLLENVEFAVASSDGQMVISIPFWRTDIDEPEDIVEEVGRLYGFDKLPRELPKRSIAPAAENPILAMKKRVRKTLKAAGANEVLTYSFVHENVLRRAGQNPEQAFSLSNALSPELQRYRLSIVPSLLAHIHANIKAGHDEFALYEFGKAHRKGDVDDDGLPREYARLGFVYAAKKGKSAPYYTARRYIELLTPGLTYRSLKSFGASTYPIFEQLAAPFDPERSAVLMDGEKFFGVIGEFKLSVSQAFKLPAHTAGFELFQSRLLDVAAKPYISLSKYPSVTQDISLKVASDITYEQLAGVVKSELERSKSADTIVSLMPISIYSSNEDTAHKTVTFHLKVTSYEKTLTDKAVGSIIDKLADAAAKELQAERI